MKQNSVQTWSEHTAVVGQRAFGRVRQNPRSFLPFIGPAIIASIAYIDPGNFATNIRAGAQFGYELLWVVVLANLIAMLLQGLSAKLGIVTGLSLAEQCRKHFPPGVVYPMWIVSELAAMATDVAEFLGGAIGLTLLLGLPILISLIIVGMVTYIVLLLQVFGFRPMEVVIGTFVSIISLSYVAELILVKPDWPLLAYHMVVPHLSSTESILLAVGIVGATVMPHTLYLHSSLMRNRIPTVNDTERRTVLSFSWLEILIALGLAGLVNVAMVAMSAAAFYFTGHQDIASIETAYKTLVPLMGMSAAGIFLLSLIVSGLSSSVVGTMAGQAIMQEFVGFSIPLWVRRLVTMVPSLVVVWLGVNVTQALVLSQVLLSLVLPVPLIALIILTSRKDVMGVFTNKPFVTAGACMAGVIVLVLNGILIAQTLGVHL